MAISKRPFIYATFILSCAAIALNVTSFATHVWVESGMKASDPNSTLRDSFITYGLFSGTKDFYIFQTAGATSEVYLTCQYDENVCVWSCSKDADQNLEELLESGTAPPESCIPVTKRLSTSRTRYTDKDVFTKRGVKPLPRATKVPDQRYINAVLRICTILFLSVALFFAIIAAVLAVVNSAMNPTEPVLAIFGLYIWNGIAATSDFLVLAMWGAHFSLTLSKNVGYVEVITGDAISDGQATLGYSYWLILGSFLMHCCNLGILGVRKYLIDQEPPETKVKVEENNDGAIFLY